MNCRLSRLSFLICALLPAYAGAATADETPRQYCARVGDDDKLQPAPPSLADTIERLFNLRGKEAVDTTEFRCAGGKVLLCNVGANLPCGKANTSTDLPMATQWCRENPDSDFIPMVVTGHDTIYEWRCEGRSAKPGKQIGHVDARGFFEEYWKEVK